MIVIVCVIYQRRKKALGAIHEGPELMEEKNTLDKLNNLPPTGSNKKLPKLQHPTEPIASDAKLEIIPDFSKATNEVPESAALNKQSNKNLGAV